MRGSVGWDFGPVSALAFLNYPRMRYTNTEVTPIESIGSCTTVDLNFIYDLGKSLPRRWTKDLTRHGARRQSVRQRSALREHSDQPERRRRI